MQMPPLSSTSTGRVCVSLHETRGFSENDVRVDDKVKALSRRTRVKDFIFIIDDIYLRSPPSRGRG